jgi:peptidoglycan-N-acetylglucosamine deacetylase
MIRALTALATSLLLPAIASAAPCPGNAAALSTERVLAIDPANTAPIGRKQFPQTLALGDKEVVLTFDDGPWPGTTSRILDALKHECVEATFFVIGRNAEEHPELVRRALAEGHTVGSHTYSHPLLSRLSAERGEAEIDHGIAALDGVLHGKSGTASAAATAASVPSTPFFRFPGFASTPALLDRLKARGIVVFGADLWASDWNRMSPERELRLLADRLDATGGGIVLLHDTKLQTAAMLPGFLRELKRRGYRIVHVVAAEKPAAMTAR